MPYLGVWTGRRGFTASRADLEEIVESRTTPAEWIVRRHEPVVDEAVHEDALLDDFAELRALLGEVPVVVVADDDAVELGRQPQDVAVVVAYHALTADQPAAHNKYV